MEKATEVLENRTVILNYPIKLEEEGEFDWSSFCFKFSLMYIVQNAILKKGMWSTERWQFGLFFVY